MHSDGRGSRQYRPELAEQARRALVGAETADDVRRVWRSFFRHLGHRVLGRLLVGGTPEQAIGISKGENDKSALADDQGVAFELDTLASFSHAFTLQQAVEFVDSEVNCDALATALSADSRFITVNSNGSNDGCFVPKRAVLRWLSNLNVRLARARQFRLTEDELAELACSLNGCSTWPFATLEIMEYGQRFGLCGSAWTSGEYVFPVARVLSFLAAYTTRIAEDVLESLAETQAVPTGQALLEVVRERFSDFPERNAHVVRLREGLWRKRKMTLEEIGTILRVTRERVRQLEARFWKHLAYARFAPFHRAALQALICSIVAKQGSLLLETGSSELPLMRFLAKCFGVPAAELKSGGLVILGASTEEMDATGSAWRFPDRIDTESIARNIEADCTLPFIGSDISVLANAVVRSRRKSLGMVQRVYLALREIGRPAHYSAVAEVHNSMFPKDMSTDHNVLAALGREKYGVVWVGIRGTYALREWGYERPAKGLFVTVAEIVGKRYAVAARPVPIAVIAAEIGKYRAVVNPNSVAIATYCNPGLQQVGRDSFVPRVPGDNAEDEMSTDQIDKILREFQERDNSPAATEKQAREDA